MDLTDLIECRLLNVLYKQETIFLLFEKDNGDVFCVSLEGENSGCIFTIIRKAGRHEETRA